MTTKPAPPSAWGRLVGTLLALAFAGFLLASYWPLVKLFDLSRVALCSGPTTGNRLMWPNGISHWTGSPTPSLPLPTHRRERQGHFPITDTALC